MRFRQSVDPAYVAIGQEENRFSDISPDAVASEQPLSTMRIKRVQLVVAGITFIVLSMAYGAVKYVSGLNHGMSTVQISSVSAFRVDANAAVDSRSTLTDGIGTTFHSAERTVEQAIESEWKKLSPYLSPWSSESTNTTAQSLTERDDELCNASQRSAFDVQKCAGAPYLYVTFHGGVGKKDIRNVCKYSRDGCGMGSVLAHNKLHDIRSLRGLLTWNGHLLVAEAYRQNSKILLFGECNSALNNRREIEGVLVDHNRRTNDDLVHPYGFAKPPGSFTYLYVSAQGTNSVLRYPVEVPNHVLNTSEPALPFVLGENEVVAVWKKEGVRGIAFDDRGWLYVAHKKKGVRVYDANLNRKKDADLDVDQPISVYYCHLRNSIWVGSASKHSVYEFDAETHARKQVLQDPRLEHPAGIVSYEDDLFVVSQSTNQLLRFSMTLGRMVEVVLENLADKGERIVLSDC